MVYKGRPLKMPGAVCVWAPGKRAAGRAADARHVPRSTRAARPGDGWGGLGRELEGWTGGGVDGRRVG